MSDESKSDSESLIQSVATSAMSGIRRRINRIDRKFIVKGLKDFIASNKSRNNNNESNDVETERKSILADIGDYKNDLTEVEKTIAEFNDELEKEKNRSKKTKDEQQKLSTTGLALIGYIIQELKDAVETAKIVTTYVDAKATDSTAGFDDFQKITNIFDTVKSVIDRQFNIINQIQPSSVPLGSTERFRQVVQKIETDYKNIDGFQLAERQRMNEWMNTTPERRALWAKWGKTGGKILTAGSIALGAFAIILILLSGPIGWTVAAGVGAAALGVSAYYSNKYGNTAKAIQYDHHWMHIQELRERIRKADITLDDLQIMLDMCNQVVAEKWRKLDCLIEDTDECSICHEVYTEAECKDEINTDKNIVTPSVCNHRYHRHCLLDVLKRSNRKSIAALCPLCRRIFNDVITVRI